MSKWKEIHTLEQWQEALAGSDRQPFVILKHSTACPVSANALSEYESYLQKQPQENMEYLMVKVIESRPVSNKITEDLQVKHASPQIIYVEKSHPVWNASHWSITAAHLKAVLE